MLAQRAAKGAYMPWGLAEDAGASIAWLARHRIRAIQAFVELLEANEGKNCADMAPQLSCKRSNSEENGCVCPILAGAYLSDQGGGSLNAGMIEIRSLQSPVLIAPFLAWVADDLECCLEVHWPGTGLLVGPASVKVLSGAERIGISRRQDVKISVSTESPEISAAEISRIRISDRNRAILEEFVQRTYLPESEHSMASGAGGIRVDLE